MKTYKISYTVTGEIDIDSNGDYRIENSAELWNFPSFADIEEVITIQNNVVYRDTNTDSSGFLYYLYTKIGSDWFYLLNGEWERDWNEIYCSDESVLAGKVVLVAS